MMTMHDQQPDQSPPTTPEEPAQPSPPEEPAQPSPPAQPSVAPAESPPLQPTIDVPSPSSPGTEAPTTPISPIA